VAEHLTRCPVRRADGYSRDPQLFAGHFRTFCGFITLLGGAVANTWPLDADAQQGEPPRRIGVLADEVIE
jgi:hypothetical protein